MMADASWYDYDQETKVGEEGSKDDDGVIWVTSSAMNEKVKNRFGSVKSKREG